MSFAVNTSQLWNALPIDLKIKTSVSSAAFLFILNQFNCCEEKKIITKRRNTSSKSQDKC